MELLEQRNGSESVIHMQKAFFRLERAQVRKLQIVLSRIRAVEGKNTSFSAEKNKLQERTFKKRKQKNHPITSSSFSLPFLFT